MHGPRGGEGGAGLLDGHGDKAMWGEQLDLFGTAMGVWLGHQHHPASLAENEPNLDGGAFRYEESPELFLGRSGWGPLRVAWDTSVLIDYGDFGQAVWDEGLDWDGDALPHGDEVGALIDFMCTWEIRDVRIHVFNHQIEEFERSRDPERVRRGSQQVVQLQEALACLAHGPVDVPSRDWRGPDLSGISGRSDRRLVLAALTSGCHAFLTRDRRILSNTPLLASHGLLVVTPRGMVDILVAAGEAGFSAGGVLPDSHKSVHLMAACGL